MSLFIVSVQDLF